ncbi:class I SAM-dependent methyltransferase [Streptomyces beijiangensis]|uniref:Class I SAM-dependent methyltransferase n=2 Tax=Streptomyces beijiangensis TaxID=163361 RepID=A0A939JGE1_9ACTN|nr:class I SAM-dependent methyltransferase [Streptomyces beijiangensis]
MYDFDNAPLPEGPAVIAALRTAASDAGFLMSCDDRTGAFLATLAAAVPPGGRILELGTGVGAGSAWLLSGMAAEGVELVSVELDETVQAVARKHLGDDPRVSFVAADGGAWLDAYRGDPFDLVFADTWPGKFTHLDGALKLVKPHGTYVIDDLYPQPGRPEGHQAEVDRVLGELFARRDFTCVRMGQKGVSCGVLAAERSRGGSTRRGR